MVLSANMRLIGAERPVMAAEPPVAIVWRLQFRLVWMFAASGAVAVGLSAVGYSSAAKALLLVVLGMLAPVMLIVWTVDAHRVVSGMLRSGSGLEDGDIDPFAERQLALERQAVEELRREEREAAALFQIGRGPLENVFRTQGLRAIAEINLLRQQAAERTSRTNPFQTRNP